MSDFEFPDLPSDEELGITDEDRDAYDKEFGNEAPDTSDAEVAELLGDTPSSTNKRGEAESTPSSKPAEQASKSAARDAKKAADRKSTRLNSSHSSVSRMPSSA